MIIEPSQPASQPAEARGRGTTTDHVRPCLDVVGFTSIHMCWSGLRWNLIQVPLQTTPTHVDWCESDCIQTKPHIYSHLIKPICIYARSSRGAGLSQLIIRLDFPVDMPAADHWRPAQPRDVDHRCQKSLVTTSSQITSPYICSCSQPWIMDGRWMDLFRRPIITSYPILRTGRAWREVKCYRP